MIRDAAPSFPATPPPRRVLSGLRALAREQPVALRVRGGCMAPLVGEGERVEVVAARCYWPGDVVAFAAPDGRLLLHRLLGYRLAARRLACVTQGDGCSIPDPPVPRDRLLGRMVGPVPLAARLRAVRSLLRIAGRRLFAR
jgi:hypothetical protein